MSDVYARSIFIRIHFKEIKSLNDEEKHVMESNLARNWDRIYNPINALAFMCGQFYSDMHASVVEKFEQYFGEVEKSNFTAQYHEALKLSSNNDHHFNTLMADFGSSYPTSQTSMNESK